MATPTLDDLLTEVEYPSEDGRPMAETDFQRIPLMYAIAALTAYFQDRPDVYVSGNILIYYEEGNPKASISPDVFVVMGVPKRNRRSYFIWKERKAPDFIIEITSRSTYNEDQGIKRGLYAVLGVREYFQYDPTGDYLQPALRGLKLVDENYLPIPTTTQPDGTITLYSSVLGLELHLEGRELRFYDPNTSRKLLTYQEAESARQAEELARLAAEARADKEAAARIAAEARLAELETRLQDLESGILPPKQSP
jgi:Uma2 family endonuclease